MGKKSEYQREVKKISDGSTNVDIELDAVPMGFKRTIQNISCEDETKGLTEIRIGYKNRFDRRHWWIEQESPQAAVLYWTDSVKIMLCAVTSSFVEWFARLEGVRWIRYRPMWFDEYARGTPARTVAAPRLPVPGEEGRP